MKTFFAVTLRLFFVFFLTSSACSPFVEAAPVGSRENPFVLASTTPTLHWEKTPGAEIYALYISRYPYCSKNLVYQNKSLKVTSFKIPEGCLVDGERYRWNVLVREKSEWKDSSDLFYFRVKLDKPTAEDWYLRGNEAFAREDYEKALDCYTKLIEMEPDVPGAYYVRGTVYGAKKEYEKAVADFDCAILLYSDYAEAYYARAIVYSSQKEYGKAAEDIKKSRDLGFPVNQEMAELLLQVTEGSNN